MKTFLLGLFLFCSMSALQAEENDSLFVSSLPNNELMNPKLDFYSYNGYTKYFSTGQRVGFGFLNLFLGLGSFIMGDWPAGLSIILLEAASFGSLYGGVKIINRVKGLWSDLGKGNWGPAIIVVGPFYALLGGLVGVVGITFIGLGVVYTAASLVMSFVFPAIYRTPRETKPRKQLINWENFNFNLLCDEQGRLGGQLLFSIKLN